MRIIDRQGNEYDSADKLQDKLGKMYGSACGRAVMKAVTNPIVSKIGGWALSTGISAAAVDYYAEKNGIDLFDYETAEYKSFNDFFTRKIKRGRRLIDSDPSVLVCPSDGKVTAYEIAKSDMFVVKNSVYSVHSLLRDRKLADRFAGGTAVIIRLTPDDYHRYIYPCSGLKSRQRKIEGSLHAVRPLINECVPVYKENSREYCLIRSEVFGDVAMIEVGATMVGRITNYEQGASPVSKGREKGRFEFGGSTIILLLGGKVKVCEDILDATKNGCEMKLKLGEAIAVCKQEP
ncbi:phosphatidylserine decarboxylase [Ruminococcus sp. YE71]|uniref:phosphatidylserine decarboxylase n=1 Tax=unclassified Ruminococcus TaxID=2608920 RepID=UPI00087EB172|nr:MULTISPECIES: phosphatidylserine decarboxylase [unclassified Ruminococcus]SDA16302.1 phosphatidylserine decarboxylase [Ruminococcus sp. YE78]SFW24498.1 phosphatidylserine decarboxylase [Ruminococcus sp. YE71]